MNQKLPTSENMFQPPYLFVLREGKKIDDDFLDYSLVLLKMSGAETMPAPHKLKSSPYLPFGQVIYTRPTSK